MFHIAKTFILIIGLAAAAHTALFASAKAAEQLTATQQVAADWDRAAFSLHDPSAQLQALGETREKLALILKTQPDSAPARAWKGIVLATEANAMSGLAALNKADAARKELELAIGQDPNPTGDGFALAILGTLYDSVPGFPIGFGDKKKAFRWLKRALELNPQSMDAGYFMGIYYAQQKDYDAARKYLLTAKSAPPRPGRETADRGRLQDIDDLLREIGQKGS